MHSRRGFPLLGETGSHYLPFEMFCQYLSSRFCLHTAPCNKLNGHRVFDFVLPYLFVLESYADDAVWAQLVLYVVCLSLQIDQISWKGWQWWLFDEQRIASCKHWSETYAFVVVRFLLFISSREIFVCQLSQQSCHRQKSGPLRQYRITVRSSSRFRWTLVSCLWRLQKDQFWMDFLLPNEPVHCMYTW